MAIDLGEVTGLNASKARKKETTEIANGLDKDAFMKLFLEQLKNQDPTAPMETDKIITQTAQLTQVEMQEENKKTMKEVASAMKSSEETNKSLINFQNDMKNSLQLLNMNMEQSSKNSNQLSKITSFNAVSMIGKIAETNKNDIHFAGGDINFNLYFDNKIDSKLGNPKIEIVNQDKEVIRTISLDSKDGMQGYINFSWDGKNDEGIKVPTGNYSIVGYYNLNEENKYLKTRIGRGEVSSIIYQNNIPFMRMGEEILPLENALEFYPKGQIPNQSIESLQLEAKKAFDNYKTQEISKATKDLMSEQVKDETSESENSNAKIKSENEKIA